MRPSISILSPVLLIILALAITGGLAGKGLFSAAPLRPTAQPAPTPAALGLALPSATAEQLPATPADETATPTASPTATPIPPAAQAASDGAGRPPRRIALQAGHWRTVEQPAELAVLRRSTGAEGPGWSEREVNLDIARRAAGLLQASGFLVDVLPAALPERYQSDVFLALHGDANADRKLHGFKVARGTLSAISEVDDALVATIYRTYGRITGLPRDDKNITSNMRYYYAFAGSGIKHAVAPATPAAILEMGFLTNDGDRALLLGSPDIVAEAVAAALTEFLGR